MPSHSSRLLIALVVVLAFVAPHPAAAQDAGPIYIVQEGDTLIGIAFRFGTTVEALAAANGLADPGAIFPGLQIRIPGFEGVSGVLTTRSVAVGDSLESIALRYATPPAFLARLNRLVTPTRLYVDLPLIVPVDEEAVPVSAEIQIPSEGTTPLSLAVRTGSNPWIVAALNGDKTQLWHVPFSPRFLPGGTGAVDAFPGGVVSVDLDPIRPVQGDTTVFRVQLAGPGTVAGTLGTRELHFFPEAESGQHVALQGIHALQDPGLVEMTLTFATEAGETFEFVQPVRIEEGDYGREVLSVPAETVDPETTGPEDALIAAALAPASPTKMWSGPFLFPTDYFDSFPSFYGTRRNYNNTGWSYYHTGLDLYGNRGKPITAPAPGIVVFAGPLTVRGNTTYIDHGWGVYTGYLHQSEILVEAGQRVEAGEVVGAVGDTGRVTGPHLHWEIWVGGVPVQPFDWTGRAFP